MLLRFFVSLFFMMNSWLAIAQEQKEPQTYGVLEAWAYQPETRQLSLRGWSLGGRDGQKTPALVLTIRERVHASSGDEVGWSTRVDIPSDHPSTGGQMGVGFDWHVSLPDALPAGTHSINLVAVFPDGKRAVIKGAETDVPTLVIQEVKSRHWRLLVFVLLGIPAIFYFRRRWKDAGPAWQRRWLSHRRFKWCIPAAFLLLVAMGVTGSSMGFLFNSPYGKSMLDVQGASRTILGDEGVRGDEWGVQLPSLLAQLHHKPRFPVLNTLVGEGGQNMGVLGMTGVPVQQWAALARPATWGYFFLPLSQAMAWHWQLPFWGCLFALWWMLNVLRPAQRGLNLTLSAAFCLAPYAAAWSNWPLYVTAFPALAFVVVTHLLRSTALWKGVLLGAVLGWLLACWCLVLYPAWIIVVGSAMAFIGLGWCLDNRRSLHFGAAQWAALLSCIAVLAALLGSWWLDTREAVAIMQATEYPGRRGAMPGGDLGWWWHLRGYHAIESIRTTGLDSNPSEASSYIVLPLLMLALVTLGFARSREARWTLVGCAVFMVCYWVYTLVGIPIKLARVTLWGNLPVTRMDVGLGLVITVLLCLYAPSAKAPTSRLGRAAALSLAAASAGLVVMALLHTPMTFVPNVRSPVLIASMALAALFISGWVLWGRMGSAMSLMLGIYVFAVLSFNPLRLAPDKVDLAAGHRPFVVDEAGNPQRTVVLNGDGIGALIFAAAGIPIANGVFYYPHPSMWDRMGLAETEWSKVNRYQHLGFYILEDVAEERGYRILQASLDQVHVHVHPRRFDFSCTGATRVAAPAMWADALAENPGLTRVGTHRDVVWLAVKPSCSTEVLPAQG